MSKKKIKIAEIDHFIEDSSANPFIGEFLQPYFEFIIDKENPDIIFHDYFDDKKYKYKCPKILFTGENRIPDFNVSDYSFSYQANSDKNFQMSIMMRSSYFDEFLKFQLPEIIQNYRNKPKSQFCNFIYRNEWTFGAILRKEFAKELMQYKKVDCPGLVLNNMPSYDVTSYGEKGEKHLRRDHLDFLSDYKFTIAFENNSASGYVTEKIYNPILVGSIPIYWGAEDIEDYFNPRCFINCRRYKNFAGVIKKIKEIDNNPELYQSYFQEPAILKDSKLV